MTRNKEKLARTSITVPEQLLTDFKRYCDQQRRSVSAQITLLMEEALKQSQKDPE